MQRPLRILCFVLMGGYASLLCAQEKQFRWFPDSRVFPRLSFDLLETQTYAGLFYLNSENQTYQGAYLPVNLGLQKVFVQGKLVDLDYELALGAASYTQFEVIKYDAHTLRGGLLNTDYKASGFFSLRKSNHALRLQVFHISSHLGDDYLLRNEALVLNNKTVNYEQVDILYMYSHQTIEYYAGLGGVITPHAFRKRFMAEIGLQGKTSWTQSIDWVFGFDAKIYHQNNFIPDIHWGTGIVFKAQNKQQLGFSLDGYFGHMPYSTLDYGKVYWIGLSSHLLI
ncbi:MAG: hypothetical protein CVU09_17355 [Bacteroidetes bacterium HGW-Bacteroidetes-4]|nr:MAG: hypothetical protein CVU09_17355 [Bacteroidetes bacterium HGW-Bacteroidetes-4]